MMKPKRIKKMNFKILNSNFKKMMVNNLKMKIFKIW